MGGIQDGNSSLLPLLFRFKIHSSIGELGTCLLMTISYHKVVPIFRLFSMLSVQNGCATLHALISQVRRRLWRRPRRRLRRRPWRSINALTVWFVIVTFAYLKRVDDGLQTANGISYEL